MKLSGNGVRNQVKNLSGPAAVSKLVYRSIWLPLEGKLSAKLTDEVCISYQVGRKTAAKFSL